MNIFDFRDQLIGDYRTYVQSFIAIKDDRIKRHVEQAFDDGALWQEPRIQLNPAVEPECSHIFRRDKDSCSSEALKFCEHHLGDWIKSDGRLRDDAELFDAFFDELPFKARGKKITARLQAIIAQK